MCNRIVLLACIAAMGISARADEKERLRAVPFVFVGKADDPQCGGTGTLAGSNIVTSAWLRGMGLPDDGQDNTTAANLATGAPSRRDPHLGLLLNKNGPTADCSAAGARIRGVEGRAVEEVFPLGFDIRNGTHCGAGSPRFNVTFRPPNSSQSESRFVGGCANGVRTPAPQDLAQWSRVVFANTGPIVSVFPTPIPGGSRIESITLLVDEGTDAWNPPDETADGVGLSVVDNILVSGQFIRRGDGIAPHGDSGDDD